MLNNLRVFVLPIDIIYMLGKSIGFTILCHFLLLPRLTKVTDFRKIKLSYSDLLFTITLVAQYFLLGHIIQLRIPLAIDYLLYASLMVGFYKVNLRMGIYVLATQYATQSMSVLMSKLLKPLFSLLFVWTENANTIELMERRAFISNIVQHLSVVIITLFFVISTSMIIGIYFPKEKKQLTNREFAFLIFASAACIAFHQLYYNLFIFDMENKGINVFEEVSGIVLWASLLSAFLLASVLATLFLFRYQVLYYAQQQTKVLLQNQMRDIEAHVKEVEKLYTGIRGMKHDMKNHMASIARLLKMQGVDNSEINQYFSSIDIALQKLDYKYSTGHPVTDVIINECAQKLDDSHITFDSQFQYPIQLRIDPFDISIILSNALDNSIEATKVLDSGFVNIRSYTKGALFFIEVQNSYHNKITINSLTDLPITSKSGSGHGLGLLNIQSCARKYHGEIVIKSDDNEFSLLILLNGN